MSTQSPLPQPSTSRKKTFYHPDLANDLAIVNISKEKKEEILNHACEYVRCVIPHFTNWDRYLAFARIVAIGVIAEFRGDMLDLINDDRNLFGYDLDMLLTTVFGGLGDEGSKDLAREFRTFLLVTAEKSDKDRRTRSELFRRYVNALAIPPKDGFRLRDCDGLVRFTFAAALACNDAEDTYASFNEEQLQILGELGAGMYDAVAFYKHRAEGEVNSTFAYADDRVCTFRRYREVLWALDLAWAASPAHRCVANFLRNFGGPIHMMMHRYRFVEDGLTVGNAEYGYVVDEARKNVKLWHRIDAPTTNISKEHQRYQQIMDQSGRLMFPGFVTMIEKGDTGSCKHCNYRSSYGAEMRGEFGGVKICDNCKGRWRRWIESFEYRAAKAFPELEPILKWADGTEVDATNNWS